MTGKTHKAFGLAAGLGVLSIPQVKDALINNTVSANEAATAGVLFLAGCILGSMLCDADNEESTAGWWLYPVLRKLYAKDRESLAKPFWHRHAFHSVWAVLLFALIGVGVSLFTPLVVSAILFGLTLGFASHVFSDWIMSKVYLFSPFSEKGFSLLHLEGVRHEKARKVCDRVFYVFSLLADAFLIVRGVIVW